MLKTLPTAQVIHAALDALSLRQQVTAHNIANATTPGYKPLEVRFESALAEASRALAARPTTALTLAPDVRESRGESVTLDQEVATLTETALKYQALTRAMTKEISILSLAMGEGRK